MFEIVAFTSLFHAGHQDGIMCSLSFLYPKRALTVMFEIMKSCGQAFLQHWWVDLFSMVYKIFDVSKFTDVQFDVSCCSEEIFSSGVDYITRVFVYHA